MSIRSGEILEAVRMVADQSFDVCTITIGIDLHDCASDDISMLNQNIYNRITTVGEDLVVTAKYLSAKYGVSIVNQRISIAPVARITAATHADSYISMTQTLDKAVKAIGVSFISDSSVLVQKDVSPSDEALIRSIPEAMKTTDIMCSSISIGSTRTGINMDVVELAGEATKYTVEITPESFDCVKVVVSCSAVKDNPFIVGVFRGSDEVDAIINVDVSGPGVVKATLENSDVTTLTEVAEVMKKTASRITRVGELIGREALKMLNIPFGILNLSLAPTPTVDSSVVCTLEEMGLNVCGAHDATAALTLLNDTVKKGGMVTSSAVGGLSGAFIPAPKDEGMIATAEVGVLTLDEPEAITVVCPVGLDMIAVPDNTPTHTISGAIADEAATGMINSKTTTVRIIPVTGKTVGDSVELDGLLDYAPVMPVRKGSCGMLVNRGDRIPVSVQSVKN